MQSNVLIVYNHRRTASKTKKNLLRVYNDNLEASKSCQAVFYREDIGRKYLDTVIDQFVDKQVRIIF